MTIETLASAIIHTSLHLKKTKKQVSANINDVDENHTAETWHVTMHVFYDDQISGKHKCNTNIGMFKAVLSLKNIK